MSDDVNAALAAATEDYAVEINRHNQLLTELQAAQAAHASAVSAAAELIQASARGDEITAAAVVDARHAADRLRVDVEIAEAKTRAHSPSVQAAMLQMLRAEVACEQARHNGEIEKLHAAAEGFDNAMNRAQDSLAVFSAQAKGTEQSALAARALNVRVHNEIAGHRLLPADEPTMHKAMWPKVHIPPVGSFRNIKLQAIHDAAPGSIHSNPRPLPSLSVLVNG
jgi:hypothetical protein